MVAQQKVSEAEPASDVMTAESLRRVRQDTGLTYYVADSLSEVLEAWGLVYHSYRRAGLISPNPYGLHTTRPAVGPQTAVVLGRIGPVVASTLSTYLDQSAGLPLDTVYADELAAMRERGRRLCEVGLFADRREQFARSSNSLFELMRYAFFYGIHGGCDDLLIGVHPRHAPFYERLIGFDRIGEQRSYSTVNDHPVVLLRLELHRWSVDDVGMPRGQRFFHANPLPPEQFARRYRFVPEEVRATGLRAFL